MFRVAVLSFAAALALVADAARAADIVRGQQVYNTICASCHNPFGAPGPEPIKTGANDAATIRLALQRVEEMKPFAPLVSAKDADDLAAYLGLLFATDTPQAAALEYYHAEFDHYFMTTIADEIVKLDNGTLKGWTRTGRQFNVYAAARAGLAPVCRFFSTAFGLKSSHFYTASAGECADVKANPDWLFEDEVFFVALPAADGSCPAGTVPVYRMYNDGQGDSPNHRFTVETSVREEMLAKKWIPEGQGAGVTMCAPA